MATAKELLSEYHDALELLNETRTTLPTGRRANPRLLKAWESAMAIVRRSAKQKWVDYVIALLREKTVSLGGIEVFEVDIRLSMCLEPGLLAKLIKEARELGLGGYRWVEEAVTREIVTSSTLQLCAQTINLDDVIDLVVVRRDSDRASNVNRLRSQLGRV